jgi:cyclopropane-fatty-acyl-phospholipid synthase
MEVRANWISKRLRITQRIFFKLLAKIQFGKITISDSSGTAVFSGIEGSDTHHVHVTINQMQAYKKILFHGSTGASESYMHHEWDVDDLIKLIEIVIKNEEIFANIEGPFVKIFNYLQRCIGAQRENDITKAKQNIIAHYDLGNDFFKLFLDPSMMYSCALYEPERISLEQASMKKLETICQQLQLKPTDHVLEIGTGWGGFAIYAARKYGCKITTTTISDKQYAYVKREIEHLGLQNRIELLNQDYRQLSGQYDKLVSIEMIEAIGSKYFDVYFRQCNNLLKPNGLFFLQAITINDQAYLQARDRIDFIKKYIFPGGCLPSINVISNCIANHTQMQLLFMRDIGKHYATTLIDWLRKFDQHVAQVKDQGFSEQFIRMWRFYFCYCAAGFKQSYISDIHALWRKRG